MATLITGVIVAVILVIAVGIYASKKKKDK